MIAVENLTIVAGDFRLEGIEFAIPSGSYGVLTGRTGCGKTTILETICGLRTVVEGRVRLMDAVVNDLRPGERGIGFVPQESALFSTMTVRQQLGFGPRMQRWRKEEIRGRVAELAEALAIEDLLERKPAGLSGGERQRVALGRALATRPKILCLDEPLSALDDHTRGEILSLIEELRESNPFTALHITHNQREAERLADLRLRLDGGILSVA